MKYIRAFLIHQDLGGPRIGVKPLSFFFHSGAFHHLPPSSLRCPRCSGSITGEATPHHFWCPVRRWMLAFAFPEAGVTFRRLVASTGIRMSADLQIFFRINASGVPKSLRRLRCSPSEVSGGPKFIPAWRTTLMPRPPSARGLSK